jgi:hypothetical protein
MKSKLRTNIAVLRSYLGKHGHEKEFSLLVGKSPSWVKKVSAGSRDLTRGSAFQISAKTLVCPKWLLAENKETEPVTVFGELYTHEAFKQHYTTTHLENEDIYTSTLKALMYRFLSLWEKNKKSDEALLSISERLMADMLSFDKHTTNK